MKTPKAFSAVSAITLVAPAGLLFAGPLNPPAGPVASTMKTMTEVEPRMAINQANTPGDADSLFKITAPGSYYLTGNITGVAGKHGIEIAADGVTLDLNGFVLAGVTGSFSGVNDDAAAVSSFTVKNGTVRNWGHDGVNFSSSTNGIIEGVHAEGNGFQGISAGTSCVVTRCTANSNASFGMDTGNTCTVSSCTARNNGGSGVQLGSNSVARDTVAYANTGDGLSASFQCSLISCIAFANSGTGIYAVAGSLIENCNAANNHGNGIRVTGDSVVRNNVSTAHSFPGMANILVEGGANTRLEGNQTSDGNFGIRVAVAGTILTRNTCSGNTTNWSIVAGNSFLIVQAPTTASNFTGNAGGGGYGTTDPNANISY